MVVPRWITFVIAALVLAFGAYRLWIGVGGERGQTRQFRKKGLYGLPRRTHLLFGVLYMVMGGMLLATGLGFRPW